MTKKTKDTIEEKKKTKIDGLQFPKIQSNIKPVEDVFKKENLYTIDIKYPLIPAKPKRGEEIFAYTHIYWDEKNNELRYDLIEPELTERENQIIELLKEYIREKIDIDFDLRQIPIKQGKVSSQVFVATLSGQEAFEGNDGDKHYRVEFRLPKGGDQEELAPLTVNNEPESVNKLLARCIQRIDGVMEIDESQIEKLSPFAREKIEKTMAELAPRIDLEMEAKCPECGKAFSFPFNMSQFFIDEMRGNLNQLYQEVHFLAFYYKWSESDILSMTRKKRRNYLELLNEHVERRNRGYA